MFNLKVAVSEDVQKTVDEIQILEEWDSQRIPDGKCLRDARIARILRRHQEINRMLLSRHVDQLKAGH
jgi:hypothetical protein